MRNISPANYYLSVTPQEEIMLRVILKNPGITTGQVKEVSAAKSLPSVSSSLSRMERQGFVEKQISGRHTRWNMPDDSIAKEIIQFPS